MCKGLVIFKDLTGEGGGRGRGGGLCPLKKETSTSIKGHAHSCVFYVENCPIFIFKKSMQEVPGFDHDCNVLMGY